MDYLETELTLLSLSEKQVELAEEYREARRRFGAAKHNLLLYLVPRQSIRKYQRSALDRQVMMLISDMTEEGDDEGLAKVGEANETFIKAQQEYKGLEKLIDAYTSRITVYQSLMRWQREND